MVIGKGFGNALCIFRCRKSSHWCIEHIGSEDVNYKSTEDIQTTFSKTAILLFLRAGTDERVKHQCKI